MLSNAQQFLSLSLEPDDTVELVNHCLSVVMHKIKPKKLKSRLDKTELLLRILHFSRTVSL